MRPTSLSRNIAFTVSGYVAHVVISFLIAPIIIHTLGNARYGAWALVSELVGYYGLLDLGIRGAVTYYVARYSAQHLERDIKETISSAFWVLAGCGGAAFFTGIGFTLALPHLFRIEGLALAEVQQTLIIMSAVIGLSLPLNVFSGSLVGKERFDVVTGIEIVTRILTAISLYVVLKAGGGLVALALVQAAGRTINWGLTLTACRRLLGGVFARPAWFRRERVRALAGYGVRNAVGNVAQLVIYRLDLVMVGMFVGIEAVTYYTIGATLVEYASSLCSNITRVFTPRFTTLQSSNAAGELHRLYLFAMRFAGMVVSVLGAGVLLYGRDFIRLWVGPSYVSGPWTARSDVVLTILMLANLPRMLQSVSWQLLYGVGRVRFLMWLNVGEAVANLGLSLLLVRFYGPAGVALGTLFPLLISHVLILPVYICGTFSIRISDLLRKGILVPLLTGGVTAAISLVILRLVPPYTWNEFFLDVFITVLLSGVFCLTAGFSREERREQLARLRSRFRAKRAGAAVP